MSYKLTDNSKEVISAKNQQVLKALEMCGLDAEGYAKMNLTRNKSVDTGALRNSVSHKVVDENNEMVCYIGSNLEYAPYVEFGTGEYYMGGRKTSWTFKDSKGDWHMTNGQRAKPYLKPAVTEHTDEYRNIIKQELKG